MTDIIVGLALVIAASLAVLWREVRKAPLVDADETTYAHDDGQAWTDADFDAITAMCRGIDLETAAETATLEGTEVLYESYADYVRACILTCRPAPQMDEFVAMELDNLKAEADEYADVPQVLDYEWREWLATHEDGAS